MEETFPGYDITWDNAQFKEVIAQYGLSKDNKQNLFANAYKAKNTVSTLHLAVHDDDPVKEARDICLEEVLPNNADHARTRESLEALVGRYIVKLPHFKKHYNDCVTWHIPHEYTHESSQKGESVRVN